MKPTANYNVNFSETFDLDVEVNKVSQSFALTLHGQRIHCSETQLLVLSRPLYEEAQTQAQDAEHCSLRIPCVRDQLKCFAMITCDALRCILECIELQIEHQDNCQPFIEHLLETVDGNVLFEVTAALCSLRLKDLALIAKIKLSAYLEHCSLRQVCKALNVKLDLTHDDLKLALKQVKFYLRFTYRVDSTVFKHHFEWVGRVLSAFAQKIHRRKHSVMSPVHERCLQVVLPFMSEKVIAKLSVCHSKALELCRPLMWWNVTLHPCLWTASKRVTPDNVVDKLFSWPNLFQYITSVTVSYKDIQETQVAGITTAAGHLMKRLSHPDCPIKPTLVQFKHGTVLPEWTVALQHTATVNCVSVKNSTIKDNANLDAMTYTHFSVDLEDLKSMDIRPFLHQHVKTLRVNVKLGKKQFHVTKHGDIEVKNRRVLKLRQDELLHGSELQIRVEELHATVMNMEHVQTLHLQTIKYNFVERTTKKEIRVTCPAVIPVPKMEPALQITCGPLLRYDTVVNGVWQGACLIVTADDASVYKPRPELSLGFPCECKVEISKAQALHQYEGAAGSFTFWRWTIRIRLNQNEMNIQYRINGGQTRDFYVPSVTQNLRWAAYSCNGFSTDVTPLKIASYKGPGHASASDPLWTDLLQRHAQQPFHAIVGGGDQLYCDLLLEEPELLEWSTIENPKDRVAYKPSKKVADAVDWFYFRHNCEAFSNGQFARAIASIPMINMLDDHDIIDGYGTYPASLMTSPMFQLLAERGYFYFLLFQCFMVDAKDVIEKTPNPQTHQSIVIGGPGAWMPYPNHSILPYMGPEVYMLLLDCRAERTLDQVCSAETYKAVFAQMDQLPKGQIKHLIVQVGIPIAYPRMNFAEPILESKVNPLNVLGRTRKFSAILNRFNGDNELLDDLNDQWTSTRHKKERNQFVQWLQVLAYEHCFRVTFLSGDVHCCAVGLFKTLATDEEPVDPSLDWRFMYNVISSAMVNPPPPGALILAVGHLANKTHRSMHSVQTDETMIPLFKKDTDGISDPRSINVMGKRNYTIVDYDSMAGGLRFDIRVEQTKGHGTTVGYSVTSPAPMWK